MRVTNNMMLANSVWNIDQNMERLSQAQQQEATQTKIQLPSDDPVAATQAITDRFYLAQVQQFQQNTTAAASWQQATDSALTDLGQIVQQVRDLTVQASSSGTLTSSDTEDIEDQVSQLKQQAVDVMNTSYAGQYLFGGYDTKQAPYQIVSTAVGDKVMFKGQYLSLGGPMSSSVGTAAITSFCSTNANQSYQSSGSQALNYDIGFNTQIAVNVEGQNVTGQGTGNLFDTIDEIMLGLNGATSYQTASIDTSSGSPVVTVSSNNLNLSDLLNTLDTNYNQIVSAQTDLGARMNFVNNMQTDLATDNTNYTGMVSNDLDVDTAQAATNLTSAQNVYEASLDVASQIANGKTLVDFLS